MKHEIAILAQLEHPNICSLWGYEDEIFGAPGVPAIIAEFCPNGTLFEVRDLCSIEPIVDDYTLVPISES